MRAITSVQQQIEVFGQNFGNIVFLVFLKQGKGTAEKVALLNYYKRYLLNNISKFTLMNENRQEFKNMIQFLDL